VDGFVLILAIIVFSVFRNFIAETKKRNRDLPSSFDTSAEHKEAQERALAALREWEAKQSRIRAEVVEGERENRDSVRIRRPGEHRTDVRLPSTRRAEQPFVQRKARPFALDDTRDAEQTRREAYDAIRELLAGKTGRPAAPVPHEPEDTRPADRPQAAPTRIERRTPTRRPRVQGTVRRRAEAEAKEPQRDRSQIPPETEMRAPAGLTRLDSLPPVARGFIYAELLGTPIALRGVEPADRD